MEISRIVATDTKMKHDDRAAASEDWNKCTAMTPQHGKGHDSILATTSSKTTPVAVVLRKRRLLKASIAHYIIANIVKL